MTIGKISLLVLLLLISSICIAEQPQKRWVYIQTNLLVDKNVEQVLDVLHKSAGFGYNGIVIADSKFMMWNIQGDKYRKNCTLVREECRKLKLEFIPCVFPNGYGNELLAHDPNLAEGLPVKNAVFIARNGMLVPATDILTIVNGGFEDYKGNSPTGYSFVDEPGKISFVDTDVKYEGKASIRLQDIDKYSPDHGHGRVCQKLNVKPYSYYHLSVMLKTEDFVAASEIRISVLGKDGAGLCSININAQKTQDWKKLDITFNTLDSEEVNLYLGVWGGKSGKIWWDDLRIQPAGFVNIIRRDGTPLRITNGNGTLTYSEGKDFSRVVDPKLGNDPWAGSYTPWHSEPQVTIPEGSIIKEGQKVFASFYHSATIYDGACTYCMAEPKVYDLYRWQAEEVKKNLQPDGYFMSHDEIRIQGWDESCRKSEKTPGALLAENVKKCTDILRKLDPKKPVYVWSDMFDPNHNAAKTGRYYLVKGDGPWYGSWLGLDKSVIVVNWHGYQPGRLDSLKHFANRGHKQILAGYYDSDPTAITDWIKDSKQAGGLSGVMYTTWQSNYNDLEAFIKAAGK